MTAPKLPPSAYGEEEMRRHYNNFDVSQGRYRFIIDSLKPASKILEVGCFLGHYTNHFNTLGHDAVGLDISSTVVKEGQRLYPKLDLRCLGEGGMKADFEANSFDAVVASEVIEHVLHPDEFLKDIARVLKPGGLLLLTTQNSNAFCD